MKKFWRNNGLSTILLAIFLALWCAQAVSGWLVYNEEQTQHREATVSLIAYIGSGHWMEATFENWESEFLQMAAYVFFTTFLFQRGSAESKDPDKAEEVDRKPDPERVDAPGPMKKRRADVGALQQFTCSGAFRFVLVFLRITRARRRAGVLRAADSIRSKAGFGVGVFGHFAVLVPKFSELAE